MIESETPTRCNLAKKHVPNPTAPANPYPHALRRSRSLLACVAVLALVFEITGASASKSPEVAKSFANELHRLGRSLALDNFEMDRHAIALARDLKPAYVKLAPVFAREIGAQEDARFVLEAMLRVFRPLEIPLIAQGVEVRTLVAVLAEIGIAGYQGFALGKPEPLSA